MRSCDEFSPWAKITIAIHSSTSKDPMIAIEFNLPHVDNPGIKGGERNELNRFQLYFKGHCIMGGT